MGGDQPPRQPMDVPNVFDDAADELKREYLAESKTSVELADAIRDSMGVKQRGSPSLNKTEMASLLIDLGDD